MATTSTITVNGVKYDLKDKVAREQIVEVKGQIENVEAQVEENTLAIQNKNNEPSGPATYLFSTYNPSSNDSTVEKCTPYIFLDLEATTYLVDNFSYDSVDYIKFIKYDENKEPAYYLNKVAEYDNSVTDQSSNYSKERVYYGDSNYREVLTVKRPGKYIIVGCISGLGSSSATLGFSLSKVTEFAVPPIVEERGW